MGFYLGPDPVCKLISTTDTEVVVDSFSITSKNLTKNVAEIINNNFDAFIFLSADFLNPEQIKHLTIPICV